MITSTYCTLIAAVADEREPEPEKPCVCEEFDPVELVATLNGVAGLFTPFIPAVPFDPPLFRAVTVWLWLANCAVESVVAPTEPLKLTEPETLGVPNAVVNAAEPPEPAVPETSRNALLSWAVDLVHPVGADVCTNSITVPLGNEGTETAAVVCVVASGNSTPVFVRAVAIYNSLLRRAI